MRSHPDPSRQLGAILLSAVLVTAAAPGLTAQAGTGAGQPPAELGIDTTNFDRSVRPQDDFYRFVNGTWMKETKIPADKSTYGSFVELRDKSDDALKAILEDAAAKRDVQPGSELQKIRDYYLSYLDTARIQALGIQPVRPELARIDQLRSKQALPELFAHLDRIGVQTPFSFFVSQDAKQATRYIAYVSQSGLGLPDRDYYFKDGEKFAQTRAAYLDYIATLLRLSGEKQPEAAAKRVMAFETALAEHHWDRAKNRDRDLTYNPKSVAELDKMTPAFSWDTFLKASDAASTPAVVVRQPDYLTAMNRVLAATPLGTMKEYLRFKLLDSYADELSTPFVDARFAFRGKTLQGLEQQEPRWKRGVGATEDALGEAVGKLYVERNFDPASKRQMEELVSNLRAAFRQGIDDLEWMTPATQREAQAKLAKFNTKIGYPDRWRDYSALAVDPTDLVGNEMRENQFAYARMVDRLGKPIDRTEWGMTPQTVNAYYSSTMNEIVFPAAILQPPFFDPQADDATNYGAIGAVIGHEISHGFDDQGRKSDGLGNLRDWWSPADAKAFQQRADRLGAEYDAFSPIPGMNVNGKLTMGENIGDLSGLAVAYKAYKISLNGKPAPVIGGFTGDQRFFMGWAQVWRSLQREDALRQRLLTDSHSPPEYRVNGVLRNLQAFMDAFNVEPGDDMYLPPEERVTIW
jgi:predicted metalloendopeptidase